MIKIFIVAAMITLIVFDVVLVFCSLIISNSPKESQHIYDDEKQLCPRCRIGKESYSLDNHSLICPYISCYKNGKCTAFKPVNENEQSKI